MTEATLEYRALKGGELWARREPGPSHYRASLEAQLTAPDAIVVVGTIDEVVVGCAAAAIEVLRDRFRLGRISEALRRAGRSVSVGEVMMDAVLDWCREQGCGGVDTGAAGHREAKNFFRRFGLTARAIVVHRSL